MHDVQQIEQRVAEARSAVDLVRELDTEGWRSVVSARFASHLGDEIWSEVDRTWQPEHCKRLAEAARNLSTLDSKLAAFDSALGRQEVQREVGHSGLAAAMAQRVASTQTHVGTFVLALRVTGIVLCELHGCIEDCQCLKDLADEVLPSILKAKITEICDGYLARVR